MKFRIPFVARGNATGRVTACVFALLFAVLTARAEDNNQPTGPVIKDGEAQIVPEFKDPDYWIRHDLWVETEFDSDGDGKLDRRDVSGWKSGERHSWITS